MKKLFVFLGISLCATPLLFGGVKQYSMAKADDEQVEVTPTPEEEPTPTTTSEEEVIDIDKEVQDLSTTAKDTIAVIKAFLNQPIVVCGVSMTIGSLIVWVFGKVLIGYLGKRNTKYDEEITKLLSKLGVEEEQIKTIIEQYKNLEEVIAYLIENTKNEKVKAKALEMMKPYDERIKEENHKVEEVISVGKEVEEEVADKSKEIRDILGK